MAGVYFLTGCTGFIGHELLRQLAAWKMDRTYCLIREREGRPAALRLHRALSRAGIESDQRFVAVAGDIELANLGLTASCRAGLAREVTCVIHAAADVRFNQSVESIGSTNVGGAKAVLGFVRDCVKENKSFSHLAYVSTAFVAGCRLGVVDADALEHNAGFKNTYEESKYLAEQLVRQSMADFPVVVVRPSIVLGSADAANVQPRDLLYPLVVSFASWPLPVIGQDPNVRVDFVPVDFVARALLFLGERSENHGRTFHLAAGVGDDLSIAECTEVVARGLNRRVISVPTPIWNRFFLPSLARIAPSLAADGGDGLEFFGPYLDQENPQFSMAATDLALGGSGIRRPKLTRVLESSVARAVADCKLAPAESKGFAGARAVLRPLQHGAERVANAIRSS
ncbi:MAG TPA: SDR family oxidoreductase [Polyangiaceae bacterium]|nr:SDR family oxidoreductase [Polyangiaceae bacterium]